MPTVNNPIRDVQGFENPYGLGVGYVQWCLKVQSGLGFLTKFGQTKTKTGPPKSKELKKLDWTAKNQCRLVFCSLKTGLSLNWS